MKKQPYLLVLSIGIIAIILASIYRFGPFNKSGTLKTDISTTLTEAINISQLSTAEFRYRGIANIYADVNKTEVRCRVCYSAIVKAGIDMSDVKITDVDTDNKTISMSIPPIDLKVTIVDEQSMNTLPSSTNVSLNTMLKNCKEDAESEARQSKELMDTAQENLKATIEGLAFPILKSQGYKIIWN